MELIRNALVEVTTILGVAEECTQINYVFPNRNVYYHNKLVSHTAQKIQPLLLPLSLSNCPVFIYISISYNEKYKMILHTTGSYKLQYNY